MFAQAERTADNSAKSSGVFILSDRKGVIYERVVLVYRSVSDSMANRKDCKEEETMTLLLRAEQTGEYECKH